MFLRHFFSRPTRVQVGLNTIYQLIGKVISGSTTLLVTILLARQFGAEGYGDFIKVTTYVGFFFLFADFGLNAIYLQREHGGWRLGEKNLAALLGIRTLGSTGLMVTACALLLLFPQGNSSGYTAAVRLGILLFTPAILFQSLITSANAVFQKYLRYDLATVSIAAGGAMTVVVVGSMLFHDIPPAMIGSLALLVGSITTATVALLFTKQLTPLSFTLDFRAISGLLVPAVPLGLTLVSNVIYAHADSVILALTKSTVEVGTYGLAYKFFETLLVVPTFFMNAVYPVLLKQTLYSNAFLSLIKKTCVFMLASSMVLGILVWTLAPVLVYLKSDFVSSIAYLRVLSLGLPLFFVSSLVMWVLITLKKQWVLAWVYVVGMVINISLNLWFTPTYGAMASAWITIVSEAAILIVSGTLLLGYIRVNESNKVTKIIK